MNSSLKKFLFTTSIDVSAFTEGEKHFIKLREPDNAEYKILFDVLKALKNQENDSDLEHISETCDACNEFCKILPSLIIAHDFTEDGEPDKKLSSKDVAEFISQKLDLQIHILTEYIPTLPLVKRRQTASAGSAPNTTAEM